MSSTDQTLQAFYDAEIAPLKGKVELTSAVPLAQAEGSYFLDRAANDVTPLGFTSDGADPAEIAARMDAMWQGTALEGMGRKLMDLAAKTEPEAEDGTVSDLIYEMF